MDPATATVSTPTVNPITLAYASSTTVSGSVTVTGVTGLPTPTGTVDFQYSLDGGSTWATFATGTLDDTGTATATFSGWTPPSAGNYLIQAVYSGDQTYASETASTSAAPLTVTGFTMINMQQGSVNFALTQGYVGEQTTINMVGFTPNDEYVVNFVQGTNVMPLGYFTTNTGSYSLPWTITTITGGPYTVELYDANSGTTVATASFNVLSSVSLSQTIGCAGDTITVIGNGFSQYDPSKKDSKHTSTATQ